jgi:hypothetical protein
MKRGKPLERRSGLAADPAKARAWQQRSAERAQANARDRGRAPLKASGGPSCAPSSRPAARSTLKARVKPPEPGEAAAIERWRIAVLGHKEAGLDPHHVVPKQVLKRIARSRGLRGAAYWAVVYDPRVGVPLPRAQHEAHTTRSAQIPLEHLPHRCIGQINAAIRDYGPEAARAFELEHPPAAVLGRRASR